MAQEGAGNYSTRPKTKSEYAGQLLPPYISFLLELELIQPHMTQKLMLRGEVGACRFTQLTSTAER